jgi:hypothetical protein
MSTTPAAQRLRQRAIVLRGFAGRIEHLAVLAVHVEAGADTWVGPSPQACTDDLRIRAAQLRAEATDLRSEARRFDRVADELDAQAAVVGPR